MDAIKTYFSNTLIGLDQFANTLLGGYPDETISSRMGRNYHNCLVCRILCRGLNVLNPNHCANAEAAVRDGVYVPPELKDNP
jgi:hypothetical protein